MKSSKGVQEMALREVLMILLSTNGYILSKASFKLPERDCSDDLAGVYGAKFTPVYKIQGGKVTQGFSQEASQQFGMYHGLLSTGRPAVMQMPFSFTSLQAAATVALIGRTNFCPIQD